jgi:DNA mismatch repair protein MutL
MIIDQKRAHRRILFEQFLSSINTETTCVQHEVFPATIELSAMDFITITEQLDDMLKLGFDIRIFGKNTIAVYGLPECFSNEDTEKTIRSIIDDLNNDTADIHRKTKERLALAMAKTASIGNKSLTADEMNNLVGKLLSCNNPNICPEGKITLTIITLDEIKTRF